MANPDDFLYEYAVVRYVPRVDREEFVNIGLIMLCKRRRWLKGRVELSERIEAFDPRLDREALERQSSIFRSGCMPMAELPAEERYRWLAAVKSAVLQVSPSHPGIVAVEGEVSGSEAIDALDKEFERLFDDLVR